MDSDDQPPKEHENNSTNHQSAADKRDEGTAATTEAGESDSSSISVTSDDNENSDENGLESSSEAENDTTNETQPQESSAAAPLSTDLLSNSSNSGSSSSSSPPATTSRTNTSTATTTSTPQLPPAEPQPTIVAIPDEPPRDNGDDVKSKAALALAAVAAAASASHKSPAEAAREARAVAHSFISSAAADDDPASMSSSRPSSSSLPKSKQHLIIKTVVLTAIRTELSKRTYHPSSVLVKLSRGENDPLLQTLLLLDYVRAIDDFEKSIVEPPMDKAPKLPRERSGTVDENPEETAVREACDRLEITIRKVDGAFQSLVDLLPKRTSQQRASDAMVLDGTASSAVIPDLLPPVAPPQGDPTVAFFRACMGEITFSEQDKRAFSAERTSDAGTSQTESTSSSTRSGGEEPSAAAKTANSLLAMFRRPAAPKQTLFGKTKQRQAEASTATDEDTSHDEEESCSGLDHYDVTIEREMLGLTVENVLERTVVRTVAPGGPAKKAGAKVGSLIVKVASVETKNLTHFETIDELRQSTRPLNLVLRPIAEDALRSAREEMGRLIKGAGFGNIMDANRVASEQTEKDIVEAARPLMGSDLRIDAYTNLVRRRFSETREPAKNKKEEGLSKVGEKLFWVLLLFVVGLEEEERKLRAESMEGSDDAVVVDARPSRRSSAHSGQSHAASDYSDAAQSVAKVLFDYTRKKLDPKAHPSNQVRSNIAPNDGGVLKRRKSPPPPPPPLAGRGGRGIKRQIMSSEVDSSLSHEKPLLQIGDVVQRTRTFLADTMSPPAALLRGELISFLCDVLDVDTEMELSEEDAVSSANNGKSREAGAGAITDLGSAGSLLKLIVLACVMRTPCPSTLTTKDLDPSMEAELKRRYGNKEVSSADIHRLQAGNRFLAVVHRLAASRSTSARITACSLGPVLWGHLDFPHQLQLRGVITRALHDVDVLVRKATATVLHEIAELVFDPRSVPWLVLMCERAMTDPEPQLRSAAMTLTWHLAEHLPNAFLGDASKGSRYLCRLPSRDNPTYAEVYLLQCKLLPVATRLAEDRSPSVRLSVAAQCDRLCDALGSHWASVVIDTLLALLSDPDERVRCEAVACVPRLARIVLLSTTPGKAEPSEISVLEALIPASIKLQKDPSVSVRVALAAAAGELLTLLVSLQNRGLEANGGSLEPEPGSISYKTHVDDRLIPMVQTLLNDSDPEVTSSALRAVTNATRSSSHQSRVRHASIASLDDDSASISSYASERPVVLPVLSETQVLRLLPTLSELGNSKRWRVRQSAVEIVPALLGCTQELSTRSEIAKLCIQLMLDRVDVVRKTAAECLCMGGSSLGSHGEDAAAEWISSIVIPNIRKAAIHSDSKQRLLSLKMVESLLLSGACPLRWKGNHQEEARMTDSPVRELAAISLSLATDRIPNVRLNVGRCLESVMHVFEEEEISFIQTVLSQQVQAEKEREDGGDRDVVYFAERCLTRASRTMGDGA